MDNTNILTKDKVQEIFFDCLFNEGEDTTNAVMVEGITTTVGFHPERLNHHTEDIELLLGELPNEFKASGGGGWSFLNACDDKHGKQWTGLHQVMEMLFQLGMGINKVKCLLPREVWSDLPGGV